MYVRAVTVEQYSATNNGMYVRAVTVEQYSATNNGMYVRAVTVEQYSATNNGKMTVSPKNQWQWHEERQMSLHRLPMSMCNKKLMNRPRVRAALRNS